MTVANRKMFVGTAGWSVPRAQAHAFPADGSQLQRYAARMNCVEINSSFYRGHRTQTYERWASSTPVGFRFAVKLPKQISHEQRLVGAESLLQAFAAEAGGLGAKWAVLLVQLPPSLRFDAAIAGRFFEQVREAFTGKVVCEPRHRSWFEPGAEQLLKAARIARVAADPGKWPGAGEPGGWTGIRYFRWHGSPQMYRSSYDEAWLTERAQAMAGRECWCIFDNTASGAALPNALQFLDIVAPS